jgi:hypothetical protein
MCNYGEEHHADGFVTLELLPDGANESKAKPRVKKEKKRKAPPNALHSQRRQTHLRRKCVAGEDETAPAKGGKVRVRFVDAISDCWYNGKIMQVYELNDDTGATDSHEASRRRWRLEIKYDDGVEEETTYPDPDIKLVK